MVAPSPLERPLPTGRLLLNEGGSQSILARDHKHNSSIIEENSNVSKAALNSTDPFPKSWSTFSMQHSSYGSGKIKAGINGSQWESSLFSSSFSDIFDRKSRLSENDVLSKHTSKNADLCEEEEPFEALEEIEAKTIGNLLPAEDDLFSGVSNELGCNGRASGGDDLEDFDLFSNVGGMELEGDDHLIWGLRSSDPVRLSFGQDKSHGSIANARPYIKHPSSYDVRAAEAALSALNKGDISGKQIKLEQNYAVGAKCSLPQTELEQDESSLSEGPFNNLLSRQIVLSPGAIASSCMENGTVQVLHSAIQTPVGAFMERHRVSNVPPNLPSPFSAASAGRQLCHFEPSLSVDQSKSANQCIPSLHPHSFPEYHDGLASGCPYNSTNAIGGIPPNVGSKVLGGINSTHIRGVGSNGHLMDVNGSVFGSPANGNSGLRGHHYLWNKSNSDRQHPSSHMIWPNSPSFVHNVSPHHLSHIPGYSRPPVMLSTSPAHHHVGSAPAINPSMWDRRHAYSGESSEASSLHLGSLGSVGFPGRSPSHPIEIATHGIFPHVAGSLVDLTKNAGAGSPQCTSHNFPGRNPMVSIPASFESPNDRVRSFSHRRIDSNSNPSDKKQYELDIDGILRGEDSRTTLMVKNIPNKYTSKMLLAAIDEQCQGTYDFIYLPIDFKNKCNVGYAFINMIDAQQIIPFYKAFNGKKWEKFNSEKVANLAYARIQGKAALIGHFQNSSLMNEDKRCRPILFYTDGPNAGDQEPFPVGPNIRPRLSKSRSHGYEENQGNHSTPVNAAEDSGNGTDCSSGSD